MQNSGPAHRLPKRILMTADTVGGVWTYALELSRELGKCGIEIALATMGAPISHSQFEEVNLLPNVKVFESRYKLEWMDDPWQDVSQAGEWLLNLEREFQPDLIHINGYCHGAVPWSVPKVVAAHSCVFSWWEAVRKEPIPESWEKYRYEVSRGLAAADVVVAPTEAMARALHSHYGMPGEARVIYNGRKMAEADRSEAKKDLVLAVGRLWDEAKNISLLDRIAQRLPWPVYAAGQSHCGCNSVNPKNIYTLGRLSAHSLAFWYRRASIFALPARYEPFGLSVLEAGLSGCALVLGDIGSLREVWGDAAIFINPDDGESLREALQKLIDDKNLRTEMASRARKRAVEFTSERMVSAYMRAYQDLLHQRMCAQCG